DVFAVPGHDLVLSVGVEGGPEHGNDVVQDGVNFGVVLAGHQLVGEGDGVLSAGDLARVHAAVNVDKHLALQGEGVGGRVGQAARPGEALVDFLVLVERGEIGGVGDDGKHHLNAAAG